MDRVVRCSLIGPGEFADRFLLPALRHVPDTRLVGVLGRDPARTAEFAARHGAARVYRSLDDLANDADVDLVLIASPDRLHADHALPLIAAGKHLFIEKPMTTRAADAAEIVRRADEAGVTVAVGYHHRFHAGHRRVVAGLRDGEFGPLRHVAVHWAYPIPESNWRGTDREGWWSLAALGTHALDQVAFVAGVAPDAMQAACLPVNATWGGKDEAALVSLALPGGVTGHVCASILYRARSRLLIYTDQGVIDCVGTFGPRGDGTIMFNDAPVEFEPVDPYRTEFQDLIDALCEGRPPQADGRLGAANVALLERLTVSS